MPHSQTMEQLNTKIPSELKEWARQQAVQDFQSLSGFVAKLINEENIRREKKITQES